MSASAPDRPSNDSGPSQSGSAKSLGKAFSRFDLDGHDLPPSPAPSSPRNGKRYALATELVYTEGTDQYNASSTPIYQVRHRIRLGLLMLRHHLVKAVLILTECGSPQHLSKHLETEAMNMTIHDLETPRERI